MNCKPGDLARIVGMPPQLAEANDRIVRLKAVPFIVESGQPAWELEEKVELVLLGNGGRGGVRYWIGESVWFDTIPDKYLRPIRDPGEDAKDETLLWKPVPADRMKETA